MSALTKRGYRISKESLDPNDLKKLKKELKVRPFVPKSYDIPGSNASAPYDVFIESEKNIYIPKYKGLEMFGPPEQNLIHEGDDIDTHFEGYNQFRDYQIDTVNAVVAACKERGGGICALPGGKGKCMGRGTKLLLADGKVKNIEDVVVGDQLMGDDCEPRNVQSVCKGVDQMYLIEHPAFDVKFTVNGEHILCLRKKDTNDIIEMSVNALLKDGWDPAYGGYTVPLEFPEQGVICDPYMIGRWIGGDQNLVLNREKKMTILKVYNLDTVTKIPEEYLYNDTDCRLKLIAGILDVAAFYNKTSNSYYIAIPPVLKDDLSFLCRSLGYVVFSERLPTLKEVRDRYPIFRNSIRLKNFISEDKEYVVLTVSGNDMYKIKTIIAENIVPKMSLPDYNWSPLMITPTKVDDYFGFTLDGNGRYILDNCVVTHNTVIAIKIIEMLKKKALVVVHKGFLLNQWKERLAQWMPDAKVGMIKSGVFDIEGKDVVIWMLQSLSMKEYDISLFNQFGTIIVDECHKVPCRVYSRALFKINSPYMIGLTATPERSDGLFKIFKWFFGDIAYELKDDTKQNSRGVSITRYIYQCKDEEYSKTFTNKAGIIDNVSTLTNLCAYAPRTRVVSNITWEQAVVGRNTIVLTERVNHLNAMEAVFMEKYKEVLQPLLFPGIENTVDTHVVDIEKIGATIKKRVPEVDLNNYSVIDSAQIFELIDLATVRTAQMNAYSKIDQDIDYDVDEILKNLDYYLDDYVTAINYDKAVDLYKKEYLPTQEGYKMLQDLLWYKDNGSLTDYAATIIFHDVDWNIDSMLAMLDDESKAKIDIESAQLVDVVQYLPEIKEKYDFVCNVTLNKILKYRKEEIFKKYLHYTKLRNTSKTMYKMACKNICTELSNLIEMHCYGDLYKANKSTLTIRVGYYIGGMKEQELKESEKCEIILATYQMASTGLDIPILNTLVFATPKNVGNVFKQSTWRIMRKENKDFPPHIIDFCDLYGQYRSHAVKRLNYYKKSKYSVSTVVVDEVGTVLDSAAEIFTKESKRNTRLAKGVNPFKKG